MNQRKNKQSFTNCKHAHVGGDGGTPNPTMSPCLSRACVVGSGPDLPKTGRMGVNGLEWAIVARPGGVNTTRTVDKGTCDV